MEESLESAPNNNSNGIAYQGGITVVSKNIVPLVRSESTSVFASGNSKSNVIVNEPKRRVSIASEPTTDFRHGHDNFGFEQNPRRKISQTSIHSHSEIGPSRRKSILVNSSHDNESVYSHGSVHSYVEHKPNGLGTITSEAFDGKFNQHSVNSLEQSWLYTFCLKCRGKENTPSWEPKFWQAICPYPLCPSFRQFARICALILIGILMWITSYVLIGDSAAPGGKFFGLVVLTVCSNFGGWIVSLTTLPRLIGMLAMGIIFQNFGWVNLDGDFSRVIAELRKFALTIILIRAGLEMEPEAFKKIYKTILKLGIIPWIIEFCVVAAMTHTLLDIPVVWSFLLASVIAAVSPAVIVPCLFRLRVKGYGVAKGIPTLIVAVSGIDDALSVAIFGIITTVMFSDKGTTYQVSQAPICIIGGLGFGVIWGYLAQFIPEKGDPYVVPFRTILLFSGGLVAVYGSERVGYEGAGPLAAVFSAFTANYFWCNQGWEIDDNPVSTAFEIFWMIFEPILFGITGASLKIKELDPDLISTGCLCIMVPAIIRIVCTGCLAFGDKFNTKEKIFVALSWMSKASVQAALAPVALKRIGIEANENDKHYAEIVQTLCFLSIILTAPLGAILISVTGTKLLTKTKQPQVLEGWRRSHRPSLRDISIIDEEEEREDPENPVDKSTAVNTQSNLRIPNISYTYNK